MFSVFCFVFGFCTDVHLFTDYHFSGYVFFFFLYEPSNRPTRNSPSRFDQRAISDPRHPGSPSGMVSWNLNDHPAFRFGEQGYPLLIS